MTDINLREEEKLPTWVIYSYSSNIVQMHEETPGKIKVKSFCTLSKGKKEIMDFLKKDEELKEIFESFTRVDNTQEYRFQLKLPAGVCRRIGRVRKEELPDDSGILLRGANEPPNPDEGTVVVNARYFGFLVEEIGNSMSKLWFMCELQLGGTLPEMAIEMVKRDLAVIPRTFKDKIKKQPNIRNN